MSASYLQTIKEQWKITVLVLLFVPILFSLGVWQQKRAEEKEQLLTVYQQRQDLPALDLSAELGATNDNGELEDYRHVRVTGVYEASRYWLLDNQPRVVNGNAKVGYEVIMPLQTDTQSIGTVLVNRGWIEASPHRDKLPQFETPLGEVSIEAYIYPMQKNAIFDHNISDLNQAWPKRILQMNIKAALTELGEESAEIFVTKNALLRINDQQAGALLTQWPVINTQPEKHKGYSVQWFTMAIALIGLYIYVIFRSQKHLENE